MNLLKRKNTVYALIIGSIFVALILIVGTYWMGRTASRDTEDAVQNVSLLYLDELAGRREQVVASTLNDYISDLNVAVGLLQKEDLTDPSSLQAYQGRMKQLYNLEKFAFVDENGLIYTSQGTRTNIEDYSFDYQHISSPEISVKQTDASDLKVVIAMPVDRLEFEGTHLVVCFMELDMDVLLSVVSLQTDINSTTFCNLYAADGKTLTEYMLAGQSRADNLFTALGSAAFENGYSLEAMRENFMTGARGVVSFTYNGIRETMCYVPVHRTNWVLTYMIRESVISDQISAISDGIVRRSLLQSLLTALVMLTVFAVMIGQTRRASRLALERETSELMQQEMEERIALQDELLEQEKTRAQQDSMITALASDYRSVYYIDLDADDGICYRCDGTEKFASSEGDHFRFSQALGAYASEYIAEEYRDAFLEFIKPENIRAGLEKQLVLALRYQVRRDGEDRYEMLRIAGVRHPEDRTDHKIHAVGIGFTDIDEEMRETLSRNQALSDALAAAEDASKAKTVFLSNMSHEIRTPMNAIIGLDSLALNLENLPEAARDYLVKIGNSAEHLLSLINDILDMSRIESGRMMMHNEEFALSKLVGQLNTLFSSQCTEKGIQYNCRINGHLNDYYIGDSTKVRQILINILSNAVKFTPEGGEVEFTAEKVASYDGRTTLQFTIRDTGIGMSEEFLPKLFDSFSQENSGASNKYGSSGLGMAITKSLVEMLNGNIEVKSRKGEGTVFTVTLTLTDSDKTSSDQESNFEIDPRELSVLVIDDDPIACDHAKLVLSQSGIEAQTALSGAEALEMVKLHHARREPFNLIIVDWKMPEMDGVETTARIREVIGEESAIIILTSYHWEEILDEAKKAGVDSFISKPLFTGNLLEEFKKALKKKNPFSPAASKKADLSGLRILLAEDMEVNAQIMVEVLKMRQIDTDVAENGRIAVSLFTEHPEGYYAAILMDMRMPEMDGLEATAAIRRLSRSDAQSIPIIALTANAFDEDVQRSLQAGLNAHLSKPIQPEILFETLENLIPSEQSLPPQA